MDAVWVKPNDANMQMVVQYQHIYMYGAQSIREL